VTWRARIAVAVALAASIGCHSDRPAPHPTGEVAAAAAARPRWAYLYAGATEIRAEIAATPESRQVGLMHRRSLEPDSGMIFVFPRRFDLDFWMMNTPLGLSIAFLGDDGTVASISEMLPGDGIPAELQRHYRAGAEVRLALEMEAHWFERHGLKAGDRIDVGKLLTDVKAE